MRVRHVGAVVALAVLAGVVLAGPTVGLGADLVSTQDVDNETAQNDTEADVAFGEQVSSFAQSSAADANHTMDSGIWNVSVSRAENPEQPVRERVGGLERRIDRLEAQIADLDRENMSSAEYNARASALRSKLSNLRDAVEQTNQTANRVGVDAEKLNTLRNRASNMTGPEVAALARNITDAPRGPPEDAGPPENAGPENGTDGGPPEDAGPDNRTDQGPPEDRGPANGSDGGPPADSGNQGNDGGGETGSPADGDEDEATDSDDDETDGNGQNGGQRGQSGGS